MCLFARLPLLCRMQLLQLRYLSAHWLVRSHRLQACLPRWIVPFEAQTVERKYPDLSNIGFFSALVDEAPCWTPQPLRLMAHELPVLSVSRNAAVWYTACIAVLLPFFGTQCLPVVSDGAVQPDDWRLTQFILSALHSSAGDSGRFWQGLTKYRRWICTREIILNGETRVEGVKF